MTYIASILTTVCALVVPGSARAWTEAQVTSVSAQLDVTHPARARVDLEIGVHVDGGGLSRFELLDLDPGLEPLSDAPPEFIGSDGRRYQPSLSLVDEADDADTDAAPAPRGAASSVSFTFLQSSSAPQAGDYLLRFAYTTPDWDHGRDRVSSWSLPRWPARLGGVSVRVLAPPGSRSRGEREQVDAVETRGAADRVELHYQRVELPRTQSFEVSFELPALPAVSPTHSVELRPALRLLAATLLAYAPDFDALCLGLALGALWIVKRRQVQRRCGEQGLQTRPFLRFDAWRERLRIRSAAGRLRSAAGAGLCAAAVIGFEHFPLLAAVGGALGSLSLLEVISRGPNPKACAATAPWPPAAAGAGLLDACTLQGAVACLACYVALVALYARAPAAVSCAALLTAPLFLSGFQPPPRSAGGVHQPPPPRSAGGVHQPPPSSAGGVHQPPPRSAGGTHQPPPSSAGGVHQPPPRSAGGTHQPPPPRSASGVRQPRQPAFLRSSSTSASRSFSSRPTVSGVGSKSTSAD